MDKYITKITDINIGLDLLANISKTKQAIIDKVSNKKVCVPDPTPSPSLAPATTLDTYEYAYLLEGFKKQLHKDIDLFNPLNTINSVDSNTNINNTTILSLWYLYIFSNKNIMKIKEIYTLLAISTKSDIVSNNEIPNNEIPNIQNI